MKTYLPKKSKNRFAAARRRGTLPPGAVRLGCEALEDRVLLAGDVQFQNPVNRFDVNGDGVVNRIDLFALVSELRSGGERRLAVSLPTGGGGAEGGAGGSGDGGGEGSEPIAAPPSEGEDPIGGSGNFIDVNGDGEFDRRDAFALIGRLRSEGEDPPTGFPVVMRYTIGVFQEINGQMVELLDPDGAGPLGIAVPQNSNFLVRVFVEDLGVDAPGVARNPNEYGIGQFALDLDYGIVSDTGLVTVVDTVNPAHFEGPEVPPNPLVNTPFQTPTGPFIPVYNDAVPPRSGTNDAPNTVIRNISGQSVTNPIVFLGTNPILAFEVEFTSGPTAVIPPTVTIATRHFTGDVNNTFFNATQDGVWGQGNPLDPNNPFAILNSMVDDDTIRISIVDDTFANPDVVVLHELPAPPPNPLVLPVTAVNPGDDFTVGSISLDVTANDFVPPGTFKGVSVFTQPLPGLGTVAVNDNGTPADPRDDFLVYTPPNPFFTGVVQFQYLLTVLHPDPQPGNPDGTSPGQTRVGDVTIDFREFNFPPIVSAAGLDEAIPAIDGLDGTIDGQITVLQGDTQVFNAATLLSNDLTGDANDVTRPAGETNPQQLRIATHPLLPPEVLVNGVPTSAAGTVEVQPSGNLQFQSNPSFPVDPVNGTVVTIRYFVEDNGFEQTLASVASPAVSSPKRTPQTLDIRVLDRPDLARFSIEFFEDNAGVPGVTPVTEVNAGGSFFVQVSIGLTQEGIDAGAVGVGTAIVDMRYDSALVDTFNTAVDPSQIFVQPPFTNPPGAPSIVPPNLVDNTGGTDPANAIATPQPLFLVRMEDIRALLPNNSTPAEFISLFAGSTTNGGVPSGQNVVLNLAGGGILTLAEAEIGFDSQELLLAVGQRPVAFPDFYVLNEDVPLVVSDVFDYDGTPAVVGPTDQTRGVLQNDDDAVDAANPIPPPGPNSIKAELVDTTGIVNGVLSLEDPLNPGVFIVVTGPGAQAPPANWNGGFRFEPDLDFFHAPGNFDFFTYRVIDSNLRRSEPVQVQLQVDPVPDAPIGVTDVYAVDANPDVLLVLDAGNLTGQGGPAPEPPIRGVLNNDTDGDPGASLTARLISVPVFGTLELEDPANPGTFILINTVADAPAGWLGTFRYTPNPGVRGVIDTFLYRAIDETALESADTEVRIEIDLANVVVSGRAWIDDSNGVPSSVPFDNIFNFINNNNTPEFDRDPVTLVADTNIERTLGGVDLTLTGTAILGGTFTATGVTNSAGEFRLEEVAPGTPIPAGNYTLTADARLATFFNAPPNNNSITIDRSAADAFFGERGLKLAFINFAEFLASTSRDGIYIGYDDTPGNPDPIVWYAIDRGPGWSVFDHEIVGLTFVNGTAVLEFTEDDPLNPGNPVTFTVAVPVNNANHYSEVRQGNLRVVHIMGTAATLINQFLV